MTEFDLFVIGGGSGGVRAARIAAEHGARVAIAEADRFGGTCVIRGCVPKKLLVYASRFSDDFSDASRFGWNIGSVAFSWDRLIGNVHAEVARLEAAYESTLKGRNVTTFKAFARLDGPGHVSLSTGERVAAKTILIATGGGANHDPSLPGSEHVITSKEAFELKDLPRRVVVMGGGYIAVEFASLFAGLGAETTLIYRGEKILRGFDDDLRDGLTAALRARGITVITNDTISRVDRRDNGLVASLKSGGEVPADQVMYAIGRSPATDGLGLETVGVETGPRGQIMVDAQSQTSVTGVYAVGDVTDRVNLTPVAIREGHAFADRVFGGKSADISYDLIPTAVFTTPEIGTVGLSEEDARAKLSKVDIYKAQFRPMRNTVAGRDERMLMKLIVDGDTDRVVGAHVLGPDAAEIIQMAAVAMVMGATKADFDRTVALHPSAGEEFVTMRQKWTPPAS